MPAVVIAMAVDSGAGALRRGLRAAETVGIFARNWSGGGKLVLALYDEDGESYLGTVELHEDREPARSSGWTKRDLVCFNSFLQAWRVTTL